MVTKYRNQAAIANKKIDMAIDKLNDIKVSGVGSANQLADSGGELSNMYAFEMNDMNNDIPSIISSLEQLKNEISTKAYELDMAEENKNKNKNKNKNNTYVNLLK